MKNHPITLVIAALVALFIFGDGPAGAQENPIRGTIGIIKPAAGGSNLYRVLVDNEVWVFITKETKIFKLQGAERKPAKVEDLKEGQRVAAHYTGDVRDTCPPQVDADEVVILGDKKKPAIRGVITKAREIKGALGQVLAEEKDGKPFDEIWLFVTKDTKIFKLDGKNRKAATFEDLKLGARIEARFDDEILKSDPPQSTAIEIVILAAEKK